MTFPDSLTVVWMWTKTAIFKQDILNNLLCLFWRIQHKFTNYYNIKNDNSYLLLL